MGGDYTRFTHKPQKRYSGVLMQQGRVQLDADWNEQIEILTRRWQVQAADTVGPCAVPKATTPDGFKITAVAGPPPDLLIGVGRIYVDGLLAEILEGEPAPRYSAQPFYPAPPPLGGLSGNAVVYLDVWEREVTSVEDPELLEKALGGPDTTTRVQTVWQVKVHGMGNEPVTCETDLATLFPPSGGRLSSRAIAPPASDDPCIISPSGGYRGLENRLYRVEIHTAGDLNTARFKWSRENASVVSAVEQITTNGGQSQLTVSRIGRDKVLRFQVDDWVEVLDDRRELMGEPGEMGRVTMIDEANRRITLDRAISTIADPTRHTRVRRWDQQLNVDANGLLAVSNPWIPLEDGVEVSFALPSGQFHVGDYWVLAARTADGSVEELIEAPPRGITHHYCQLATLTGLGPTATPVVQDCRRLWPPDVPAAGCDCTVCVTAESHNDGTLTIQRAIDEVKSSGGKVCLGPGLYHLGQTPILVSGAGSVHLRGQGWKTMLLYSGPGAAIAIESSMGVTVEDLTVLMPPPVPTGAALVGGGPGVGLRNSLGVTLQRCFVLQLGSREAGGPAIGLEGYLFGTSVRENLLVAATGVGNITRAGQETPAPYLFTAGLYVQDNILLCERRGVSLERSSLHFAETRLSGNFVRGCSQGGIVAIGMVFPGSRLDVHGNELLARGNGIVIGTDGARISSNDIGAVAAGQGGDGIVLAPGLDPTGIHRCQVLGNRVMGIAGHGIALRAQLRSAMIKQNVIDAVGGGGIVMEGRSSADGLSIQNNQLLNIAPQTNDPKKSVVGIRLVNSRQAEVASNTITGVGRAAMQSPSRVGIQVVASSSVRIDGNEVLDVAPAEFVKESAGIEVLAPFDRVDVVDNVVRRSQQPPGTPGTSNWYALRIRGPVTDIAAVDDDIGFVTVGTSAFGLFGTLIRVLPRGREIVAVRGNLMEAYGDVPAIDIAGGGAFVFSDNRCLLTSGPSAVAGPPVAPSVAVISAGALIASANYLQGPKNAVAMRAQVPQGPFTVLGNIASGPIQVNGVALGAPWGPLNAIAP